MNDTDVTRVRSVMGEPPIVVDGLTTVEHAIELMRQHKISSLVIDKRYEGDEYGLLVVADIANKIIGPDRSPERTSVALLFGMGQHENGMFNIRRHVLDQDQFRDPAAACLKLIKEAKARHWQNIDLACVLTRDVESGQRRSRGATVQRLHRGGCGQATGWPHRTAASIAGIPLQIVPEGGQVR